jgi:hypothetical protein
LPATPGEDAVNRKKQASGSVGGAQSRTSSSVASFPSGTDWRSDGLVLRRTRHSRRSTDNSIHPCRRLPLRAALPGKGHLGRSKLTIRPPRQASQSARFRRSDHAPARAASRAC